MKKSFFFTLSLMLMLVMSYSCQSDDNTTVDPTTPTTVETLDVASIIEVITTNSTDGVWEAEQATLIKQNNDNIILTGNYTIEDDIFTFTQETNQTINLHWKKGFAINMQAQILREAGTDRNASSEDFTLTIDPETGILTSSDNRITANYDTESDELLMMIGDASFNDILSLNLSPKNQSDYISTPTVLTNPQGLFSYHVGAPIVGFKVSQSQKSLYITNRNDLMQSQQLGLKYNLETNTLTTFDFLQQDFATKNIEFLEGQVVSLGGFQFQAMAYEFSEVNTFISVNDPLIFNGTAALDDTVYIFGDYDNNNPDTNTILTWNIGDADYQSLASLPGGLSKMDGEIVDQTLYMFGGWDITSNSDFGSNILHTYSIDTGVQNQIVLPVTLRDTFTSTVEHIIYVMGLEGFDTNNDSLVDTTTPYLGAFNTLDHSFQEITLHLDNIVTSKDLIHFQVLGNKAYIILSELIGAPDGFINSVYEATLN